METTTTARTFAEKEVIIALAGHIAQRRCRMGSSPGWTRTRSFEEQTSYHEAGHAAACRMAGDFVYALSIVPDTSVRVTVGKGNTRHSEGHSGGFCLHGRTTDPIPSPEGESRKSPSDFTFAVGLCDLLTVGPRNWKTILRTVRFYQAVARELVAENWPVIDQLARALLQNKNMTREDIERILKPRETREPAIDQYFTGVIRERTYAAFEQTSTAVGQVVQ